MTSLSFNKKCYFKFISSLYPFQNYLCFIIINWHQSSAMMDNFSSSASSSATQSCSTLDNILHWRTKYFQQERRPYFLPIFIVLKNDYHHHHCHEWLHYIMSVPLPVYLKSGVDTSSYLMSLLLENVTLHKRKFSKFVGHLISALLCILGQNRHLSTSYLLPPCRQLTQHGACPER